VLVGLKVGSKDAETYASNAQTFRAIQARQVNDELNLAKGPQTEGDAKRAKETYAALGNTPNANQFINDLQRAIIQRKGAEAKFYSDHYEEALASSDLSSMERAWKKSPEAAVSVFQYPVMSKWNKAAPTAGAGGFTPTGNAATDAAILKYATPPKKQ
jgi:hypothetical protein